MSRTQDTATVNRHTVRRILRYGKPYIGWFALTLLIIIVTVLLELWQPMLIEEATGQYVEKYIGISSEGLSLSQLKDMRAEDLRGILLVGGKYLFSVVAIMILTFSQAAILASVGQKIVYNMRADLFRHLSRLHIGFFNDNPIGRLVTRVTNDCETVLEMFTSVVVNIISSICVLAVVG